MPLVLPRRLGRALAAVVATALLAVPGCGEPDAVAVDGAPLRLTLSEYRVEPQAVRVPAGRVEVVVRNAGTMVHRLQIRTEDRSRALATSPPIRPGQWATMVVDLPPGEYVTTCPLDRHHTLGEHGALHAR
jgi:iron uptake system component EfeO